MNQNLIDHITELRTRLLWVVLAMAMASGISFIFATDLYGFLVEPLKQAMEGQEEAQGGQRLIYTGLAEAFFTYIKISIFAGLFVTFPILLIQIWRFVAPGLYKNEKNAFLPFLVATPILFFLGGACVYYIVIPQAWPFFLGFQTTADQTNLPIQLEARISEYLSLVMTLIFAFGLCFQLPVLLTLLARSGIIKVETLRKGRKFALIIALLIAAFITPPDIISQIFLALPMVILYEVSIFLIALKEKNDTVSGLPEKD